MAIDVDVFHKLQNFSDYAKLEEEFQMRKQAQQLEQETKKFQFLGQVVGNSTDQDTYARGKEYATKLGIDTSSLPNEYNPDVVARLRFAGATPTAQLSALLQQQQMALRAGTATGDVTAFGYGTGSLPAYGTQTTPTQRPTLPPSANNSGIPVGSKQSQITDPQASIGALEPLVTGNYNDTAPLPPAPADLAAKLPPKNQGETQQAYENRLKYDPQVNAEVETAKTTATNDAKALSERKQTFTKAQGALKDFESQANIVKENIKKAKELMSGWSTGYGSYLSVLPETDAGALNDVLNTIKANTGFSALQTMRDNSPTGGALGQVSEMENLLLQSTKGALNPKQPKVLADTLETLEKSLDATLAEKKRAFEQDYGNIQPLGNNQQPTGAEQEAAIFNAKKAIAAGADREAVKKRLIDNGIDPKGL